MNGHWKHSGARIYWAERDRGAIVRPLLERLLIELKDSQADPTYSTRPHHVNTVRLRAGSAIIETVLMYEDMYVSQNLAILASEYGLNHAQRDLLSTLFYDGNLDADQFSERVLDNMLNDQVLRDSIKLGHLCCLGYTTLYPKDATLDSDRNVDTFLEYRSSALRRQQIRRELGLDTPEKLTGLALRQEQVLRMYDRCIAKPDADCSVEIAALSQTGS